jgi:hypothetical protein
MKFFCRWFVFNLLLAVLLPVTSQAGAVKPVLTITSPKAGQRLSNDVFTVTGTAAGSAGISNVLYTFNQSGWTNADTGNQWTNWSVENVTLIPGTNIFSACAVANNGLRSTTNTVKFIYVVTTTLTVLTNGNLIIKPNYNGAQLQIRNNYSMTASPGKGTPAGFGLRNWTDGSNNIVSTSATLEFTMASNLTFIANFGNILRPTIDVRSTSTNADGVPNDFIVHGTAADKAGVTNVFYQLSSGSFTGPWQTATTTNNWTNWNANVSLQPGLNNFSAYAVNVNSNSSLMPTVQISYNSAPMNLSGKSATVNDNFGNSLFAIAFSKNTFSQVAQDASDVNGVGSYTYSAAGGNAALKIKYLNPPSAVKRGSQTFGLTFIWPTRASFITTKIVPTTVIILTTNNLIITTNLVSTNLSETEIGFMQFSSVSNLAIGNIAGQLVWSVGSQGNANGVLFKTGKYTSQSLLTADTNGGSYSYTKYSPVGSLFKLTSTSGTSYIQASFADTNYGSYYEEDYDSSGHTNGTDFGNFVVASQKPGGNAPLMVTNRNFQIFSGDGEFNVQFGADTYSQDTLSANFDNDVGDYTYTNISTNIGQLNLTVIAPPADDTNTVLAGSTSAARLIFVGGNVGLFTNNDGTISTFAMNSVTNLAPASITNTTLNLTNNPGGFINQLQFASDGSFTFNGVTNGTYAYTNFSPGGAMVNIDFTDTNGIATSFDWLQLNFKSPGTGNFFVNEFDATNNFLDNVNGSFGLH